MRKHYTPRRAGIKRWLEGAPDYILDVFDIAKCADRFVVFLGGKNIFHTLEDGLIIKDGPGEFSNTHVSVLFMDESPTSPIGVSIWDSMKAHSAAAWRYKNKHRRIKWMDLPANIRKHVIDRAEEN